jgi:hypothetical protein
MMEKTGKCVDQSGMRGHHIHIVADDQQAADSLERQRSPCNGGQGRLRTLKRAHG